MTLGICCFVGSACLGSPPFDFGSLRLHTAWPCNKTPKDYFCCPQGNSALACHQRELAIGSISSYVATGYCVKTPGDSKRCEQKPFKGLNFGVPVQTTEARCFFFIVLCPALEHADGQTLSYASWERRGWCRMERMSRELLGQSWGNDSTREVVLLFTSVYYCFVVGSLWMFMGGSIYIHLLWHICWIAHGHRGWPEMMALSSLFKRLAIRL